MFKQAKGGERPGWRARQALKPDSRDGCGHGPAPSELDAVWKSPNYRCKTSAPCPGLDWMSFQGLARFPLARLVSVQAATGSALHGQNDQAAETVSIFHDRDKRSSAAPELVKRRWLSYQLAHLIQFRCGR